VEAIRQTMMELLIAALRTANGLVQGGHADFWCFAVAQRKDGSRFCLVSNEADFLPILSAQPQVTEDIAPEVVAAGPSMSTEWLAANREQGSEVDEGYEATIEKLRELASGGEIVATAVVTTELDHDRSPPQPAIMVELEHQQDFALLYAQPYRIEGGFQVGEAEQFEHIPEVFESAGEEEEDD
jgi:hypothetical protein